MFHLIVLVMFGLMAYGLWTLLGNLSKMKLPKAAPTRTTKPSTQSRSRSTPTRPISPSTERLNSIHAQAELERAISSDPPGD
jgi:hypothetical protein